MTAKDVELDLPASQSKKAPESFPGALPFKSTIQSIFSGGPDGTQPVRGSPRLRTGGLGPTTDEPLEISPKYQDTIMFFPTTKDRIFEVCAPLYTQGMSLREIAKQIDLPRTTIKAALNAGGLPMRGTTETKKGEPNGSRPMKAGTVTYGFACLEGRPVKEPKEYKVVLQIQNLWQSGKGFSAIANTLNDQKILTRGGKRWAKGIVSRILKRHEDKEVWLLHQRPKL
jgi:hypothetical protein